MYDTIYRAITCGYLWTRRVLRMSLWWLEKERNFGDKTYVEKPLTVRVTRVFKTAEGIYLKWQRAFIFCFINEFNIVID